MADRPFLTCHSVILRLVGTKPRPLQDALNVAMPLAFAIHQ